jgi:hypothetical protein
MSESHITYSQLIEIVSWGIFTRKVVKNQRDVSDLTSIDGAMHGGRYIGSPGKDIYLMLPYLSDDQMKETAKKLANKFPKDYPHTNAQYSACIRFIYGQFEKQGSLRSDKDFENMKNSKINWELPRKFLNFLRKEFEKDDKFYGLTILYEMEAHRLGDEAVINNDADKLNKMEHTYLKALDYAKKCQSYKHLFSLYYWASQYFMKFGDKKKTIKYSKISISEAVKYYHKYFPHGEQYYKSRLSDILIYIKKNGGKDGLKFYDIIKKERNKIDI